MATQNITGPQVRKLRNKKGFSQEKLAARCNVYGWDLSRGTLSKIESGLRRVNDAELMILAIALKCELKDLYPDDRDLLLAAVRQGRSD